jgi:hypothetical protein
MHTNQNEGSDDSLLRGYVFKIKELLSQSDAESWIEDLWDLVYQAINPVEPGGIRPVVKICARRS